MNPLNPKPTLPPIETAPECYILIIGNKVQDQTYPDPISADKAVDALRLDNDHSTVVVAKIVAKHEVTVQYHQKVTVYKKV